jgi:Domain of unknown function (DUF4157)
MRLKSSQREKEGFVAKATSRQQPRSTAQKREMSRPEATLSTFQRTYGNRSLRRLLRSGFIQAKLKISHPQDAYEQEADRVADQVMRMPNPATGRAAGGLGQAALPQIQRMCTGCEDELHRQADEEDGGGSEHLVDNDMPSPEEMTETPTSLVAQYRPDARVQRACGACAEKQEIRAREASEPLSADGFEPIQNGGQALAPAARAFFEPRFGHAFDHVRIHTDAQAGESARAVNALAYTVGHNIVFGAGQYKPDTSEGRRLIAHELTHVVQQGAANVLRPSSERPAQALQIQPVPSGSTILHRWHVNGPAAGNTNTIVCDGSGGVKTQLGATGDADQTRCLSDCIRKHEESHKADALAANANLCKDKAADSQVTFNGEQAASERKAYTVEINCLTPQVDKVGVVCKKIIQDRIAQITPIRDAF